MYCDYVYDLLYLLNVYFRSLIIFDLLWNLQISFILCYFLKLMHIVCRLEIKLMGQTIAFYILLLFKTFTSP